MDLLTPYKFRLLAEVQGQSEAHQGPHQAKLGRPLIWLKGQDKASRTLSRAVNLGPGLVEGFQQLASLLFLSLPPVWLPVFGVSG